MTITTCLTVSSGLEDIEVCIEVECDIEVTSYTPGEAPSMYSPGEQEQIEWECHLVREVRVGDVVVMPSGAAIELSDSHAREIEADLLAASKVGRALAKAGV